MHPSAQAGLHTRRRRRAIRWSSARLVGLYVVGLVATVAAFDLPFYLLVRPHFEGYPIFSWGLLGIATVFVVLLITGRTIYVWRLLTRDGGSAVVEELGGVALEQLGHSPDLARVRETTQDLAVRAGVPSPRLFVLIDEPGINALVAGAHPRDSAIAVTQGALERLTPAELRAVLGHEVGHIATRDVRLGTLLAATTAGVDTFGRAGRWLSWSIGHGVESTWEACVWALGVLMHAVGAVGHLVASLMEAAVGRQRELLADTASAELTGDPDGMLSALRTMNRPTPGTALRQADAVNVDSMLVMDGLLDRGFMSRALASHPMHSDRVENLERVRRQA